MESILEVLTPDNLVFIFKGFGLTLYISLTSKRCFEQPAG